MSFDVILQILDLVYSSITKRTFEPWDLVVYEGVLPVPIDPLAGLATDRAPAQHSVPLVV